MLCWVGSNLSFNYPFFSKEGHLLFIFGLETNMYVSKCICACLKKIYSDHAFCQIQHCSQIGFCLLNPKRLPHSAWFRESASCFPIKVFCFSTQTVTKTQDLKGLRRNKDIVILRPDKGDGVVIINRRSYDQEVLNIINDREKSQQLNKDPTITHENKLQRTLREIKREGHLYQVTYERIYPRGSQPARMYGLCN